VRNSNSEGFANARHFAIEPGNIFCEIFDSARNMAATHAVDAVNMISTLAVVRQPLC
jgi:hypothetical protein